MKKQLLKTFCICIISALCLSSFSSCRKLTNNRNKTLTLKGKMLRDCLGVPVANQPLDFYFKSYNIPIGGQSGIIGHTTTDFNGNFNCTIEDWGSGTISIWDDFNSDNGHQFVNAFPIFESPGATISFDTIYNSFQRVCIVRFKIAKYPPHEVHIPHPSSVYDIWPKMYNDQTRSNVFASGSV